MPNAADSSLGDEAHAPEPDSQPASRRGIHTRLLALIGMILAVAALRAAYPVAMPVVVAAIVVAAVWPVKCALDRTLPSPLSYVVTVVFLVLLLAVFSGAVFFATAQVVQAFIANEGRIAQLYEAALSLAEQWGLPEPRLLEGYSRLIQIGRTLVSQSYTVLVYVGFIGILVVLGMVELPAFRDRLRRELDGSDRRELVDTIETIAGKIRQYLGVTSLTSVMTGVATAAWAWIVGLDLALVWGLLNFLLNYIPVVGNLVGIIPPSLYALLQYQGWTIPVGIFIGFSVIQIVISNFVYPMLQGRSLSLSPVAIIVALAFWSWMWGIAGALIAVPLTAALVIVCAHFQSTAWAARLLSSSARDDHASSTR